MTWMRLDDVLARRGPLAPPEVVTLVVGLALDLADLHASGRAHGNVCAAAVCFEPDGRPRFEPPTAPGDPAADVAALAALGLAALGNAGPPGLVHALRARAGDARELAERVMASGPAAPLRLPRRGATTGIERGESPRTRPRRRGMVLVAVAALALDVPGPRHEAWRDVFVAFDRARAVAMAERSIADLRAVYAAGSPQLGRDTALIRTLAGRGLALRGHLAELTDPVPLGDGTVAAVERPAAYVLDDASGHVVLRVDTRQVRRVVVRLRHTKAGWRVVDVS